MFGENNKHLYGDEVFNSILQHSTHYRHNLPKYALNHYGKLPDHSVDSLLSVSV